MDVSPTNYAVDRRPRGTRAGYRRVFVYSLFMVASAGVTGFLPTFLINVPGVSFAVASSAFAILYGVGLISRPVSGTLSDRIPRPLVSGGALFLASRGLAVLLVAPNEVTVIGGVVVFALGQKGVTPALQAYLMDRFPDESMGAISASSGGVQGAREHRPGVYGIRRGQVRIRSGLREPLGVLRPGRCDSVLVLRDAVAEGLLTSRDPDMSSGRAIRTVQVV